MFASRIVARSVNQSINRTFQQQFRSPQSIASLIQSRTFANKSTTPIQNKQSTNQAINHSTNQASKQSTSQSTKQETSQATKHSINQSANKKVKKIEIPRAADPGLAQTTLRSPPPQPPIDPTTVEKDWFDRNVVQLFAYSQTAIKIAIVLLSLGTATRLAFSFDTPLLHWLINATEAINQSETQTATQSIAQTSTQPITQSVTKPQ